MRPQFTAQAPDTIRTWDGLHPETVFQVIGIYTPPALILRFRLSLSEISILQAKKNAITCDISDSPCHFPITRPNPWHTHEHRFIYRICANITMRGSKSDYLA